MFKLTLIQTNVLTNKQIFKQTNVQGPAKGP